MKIDASSIMFIQIDGNNRKHRTNNQKDGILYTLIDFRGDAVNIHES